MPVDLTLICLLIGGIILPVGSLVLGSSLSFLLRSNENGDLKILTISGGLTVSLIGSIFTLWMTILLVLEQLSTASSPFLLGLGVSVVIIGVSIMCQGHMIDYFEESSIR